MFFPRTLVKDAMVVARLLHDRLFSIKLARVSTPRETLTKETFFPLTFGKDAVILDRLLHDRFFSINYPQ